jgi:hypothetical protein
MSQESFGTVLYVNDQNEVIDEQEEYTYIETIDDWDSPRLIISTHQDEVQLDIRPRRSGGPVLWSTGDKDKLLELQRALAIAIRHFDRTRPQRRQP